MNKTQQILSVLVLAVASSHAQLFTEFRINGTVAEMPMLKPDPQPLNLTPGNTYRLDFRNLPSLGMHYFQQWDNIRFKVDAQDKNQEIYLDFKFFEFEGLTPTRQYTFNFTPNSWPANGGPISTGLGELDHAFNRYENKGALSIATRGGNLDIVNLEIELLRNEKYQLLLVPEPSTASLFLVGAAAALAFRKRR
jgi:hypothetical protein